MLKGTVAEMEKALHGLRISGRASADEAARWRLEAMQAKKEAAALRWENEGLCEELIGCLGKKVAGVAIKDVNSRYPAAERNAEIEAVHLQK